MIQPKAISLLLGILCLAGSHNGTSQNLQSDASIMLSTGSFVVLDDLGYAQSSADRN